MGAISTSNAHHSELPGNARGNERRDGENDPGRQRLPSGQQPRKLNDPTRIVCPQDNRLQSGDHILQIGDVNLRGMGSEQVAAVLRQSGTHVRLVVARPVEPTSPDYQVSSLPQFAIAINYVRYHFALYSIRGSEYPRGQVWVVG